MDFAKFFEIATGHGPYAYQRELAEAPWPEVLRVETGAGKTAAVVLAWLYKRLRDDRDTPRRLIYCLPMRTLVEQTHSEVEKWLERLREERLLPPERGFRAHRLMGGEPGLRRGEWAESPEEDGILIGTQDQLLSRALMRGYAMSRYAWPIHFALLHNDAFWVFDEVQLMGAGRATSAQLEAFRRDFPESVASRSLWVSATLDADWLATVDFAPHLEAARTLELPEVDRAEGSPLALRLHADKPLGKARAHLAGKTKKEQEAYIAALAEEVVDSHGEEGMTLVVLNRVDRAQQLFRALEKRLPEPPLLIHSRFRPADRRHNEEQLSQAAAGARVVIATQAIEAGVDISARLLFTELAPWASMVQRFGRCNRDGKAQDPRVVWIDIEQEADDLALPYGADELAASRAILERLENARPSELPPPGKPEPILNVLRRRDLLQLFDTDPDMSGHDIDIAPYIRDKRDTDVQVFWREVENGSRPGDQPKPARDELCAVSLAQFDAYRKARKQAQIWRWDSLGGDWDRLAANTPVTPGTLYMLDTSAGGYDPRLGFDAKIKTVVDPLDIETVKPESFGGDELSELGRSDELPVHLSEVSAEARRLAQLFGRQGEAAAEAVAKAALWHDVGKAHPAFQNMLLAGMGDPRACEGRLWAKSDRGFNPEGPRRARAEYAFCRDIGGGERTIEYRPLFRHELASALAWLEHNGDDPDAFLIAYLIAAHHGKVRLGLRALPREQMPPEPERRYARGVWDGDVLPPVSVGGDEIGETTLKLDLMEIGGGEGGLSWAGMTGALLEEHGPFRLAWLETLVRLADWRVSMKKAAQASNLQSESREGQ